MKPTGVIALAVVAVGAVGCRLSDDAPTTGRDPGSLIYARAGDALLLDPARITDNESVEVVEEIFDRLIHWQAGSAETVPGLATRWQLDPGGREWTFHLRPGVRFHDGTPVDADAVVFSLERQRAPQPPFTTDDFQAWQRSYRNIQKIEAVDPLTVRITIDRAYAPFEANLAMFTAAIVSPAAVTKWGREFADHPVGSGPFQFVRWDKGERIVLAKNADYWGGAPAIDHLIFEVIADARQRLVALESGAFDLANSILPDELQYVALHPQLVLHRAPSNNVVYLAMNTQRPPFNDLRVRRAINHAINKAPIVQMGYQGLAVPADGPLPPGQWGHHSPLVRYEYDPTRARELLAEATADRVIPLVPGAGSARVPEPVYSLYAPSTPRPYLSDPERVARALVANLLDVGVSVELVLQPYPAHRASTQNGEHDLALFGWVGDNGDPDNFLYVLFDRDNAAVPGAANLARYTDQTVHDLLIEAQVGASREERTALYARVQNRLAEDAPWVPLAHTQLVYAARRDLDNVQMLTTGHIVFSKVRRRK